MAKNKETNRVTRWFLSLQPYNFSVVHRPGRRRGNADALSRRDAFWSSFTLRRMAGLGRGMCSITRGHVVEGHYIPFQEPLPLHKMAAGEHTPSPTRQQPHPKRAAMTPTTSPRKPRPSDRCEYLSHLIEAGRDTRGRGRQKSRRTKSKELDRHMRRNR